MAGLGALGDDVFHRALKHGSDSEQGLDRRVLIGTGLKLDDGVIVHLCLLRKLFTRKFMISTHGFHVRSNLGQTVLWERLAHSVQRQNYNGITARDLPIIRIFSN